MTYYDSCSNYTFKGFGDLWLVAYDGHTTETSSDVYSGSWWFYVVSTTYVTLVFIMEKT